MHCRTYEGTKYKQLTTCQLLTHSIRLASVIMNNFQGVIWISF